MAKEHIKKSANMAASNSAGPAGFVFFVAWIGALVHFVSISEGFGGFILAILKSFVWPAYLINAVLGALNIS